MSQLKIILSASFFSFIITSCTITISMVGYCIYQYGYYLTYPPSQEWTEVVVLDMNKLLEEVKEDIENKRNLEYQKSGLRSFIKYPSKLIEVFKSDSEKLNKVKKIIPFQIKEVNNIRLILISPTFMGYLQNTIIDLLKNH